MESNGDGGEVAAKRPNLSSSGAGASEDRLSALHDDILILILLRLRTVAEAARTSVLSRRWRRTWALLPELKLCSAPDNRHVREVLAASEAPSLLWIRVATEDDAPDAVAAWLPLAARRLSGALLYRNAAAGHYEAEVDGAVPLPCFGDATVINLDLGLMPLAVPSSGAFARLTELCLKRVRFAGTSELGSIVSSPRCPGLRRLSLRHTWGLTSLAVCSKSLLEMDLHSVNGLLLLRIDAPALEELKLLRCFVPNQPVADISAPQLEALHWRDAYDPSSVEFGNLGQLQQLSTSFFLVYGQHGGGHNRDFLSLLQRFQFIHRLNIILIYAKEIDNINT